ncbi:MAG: hypothetical protein WCA46_14255 [Actinocatenispora sp.]
MIDGLSFGTVLGCLLGALVVAAWAVTGRYRVRAALSLLGLLELVLLGQAVLDVVGLARGHRPGEAATHVAYLVASLAVFPAVASQAGRDGDRWAAGLLSVALLVEAVIVVRMQATWRSTGG